MPEYEWKHRRTDERTADYLARVLAGFCGAPQDLVARARRGHFDDYFCPPEVDDGLNIHRLVGELATLAVEIGDPVLGRRCLLVAKAAKDGEFDGTKAESEEWARSPDGRALFAELAASVKRGKRP